MSANTLAPARRNAIKFLGAASREFWPVIARNTGILGALFFISAGSKLVGAGREIYISSRFGVSPITDTFFAVQQIPTAVTNYLFGAFTLAFIPQFIASKGRGLERQFVRRTAAVLVLISLAFSLAMSLGNGGLIATLTGLKQHRELTTGFSLILSLSILPIAVNGLAFGVLHAEGKHKRAMVLGALSPVFMLVSLLLWLLAPSRMFCLALPWSYVLGSLSASFWGVWVLVPLFRNLRTQAPAGDRVRCFGAQLTASSVENVAFNVNIILTVHFAALSGTGGVAINTYAQRISMTALSGVVIPMAQVAHTRLSRVGIEHAASTFSRMLVLLSPCFAVFSLTTFFLRDFLVKLIYQRGAFSISDTAAVSAALAPYCAYFFVMAMNALFARFFFSVSRGQIYTVVLLGGYILGNLLKKFWGVANGVPGIVRCATIGEGAALLVLVTIFAVYRRRYL